MPAIAPPDSLGFLELLVESSSSSVDSNVLDTDSDDAVSKTGAPDNIALACRSLVKVPSFTAFVSVLETLLKKVAPAVDEVAVKKIS